MLKPRSCRQQKPSRSIKKSRTTTKSFMLRPSKTNPQPRSPSMMPQAKPSKSPRSKPRASGEGNQLIEDGEQPVSSRRSLFNLRLASRIIQVSISFGPEPLQY